MQNTAENSKQMKGLITHDIIQIIGENMVNFYLGSRSPIYDSDFKSHLLKLIKIDYIKSHTNACPWQKNKQKQIKQTS